MKLVSKANSQGKVPKYIWILCLIAVVMSIIDSYQQGQFKDLRQQIIAAIKQMDFAWTAGVVFAIVIGIILLKKYGRPACPNCKSPTAFIDSAVYYCSECGFELNPPILQQPEKKQITETSAPSDQQSKLARQILKFRIRELQGYYFKFEIPFWCFLLLLVWFCKKTRWLENLDVETRVYMGAAIFCIPLVFRLLEDFLWQRVSKCPHCYSALPDKPPNISARSFFWLWHMYFPDFCAHCRCQLTDKDFKPDALVPFLHFSARMFLTVMILFSFK
jgi:hypothetical protein